MIDKAFLWEVLAGAGGLAFLGILARLLRGKHPAIKEEQEEVVGSEQWFK